jgi:two-component system NtrC family sensor kinase
VNADPAAGTLTAARRLMWVLVVPVLALLAVLSTLQYRERVAEAERDLLRRAEERAQELEGIARPAMAHVQDLRAALEEHWHDPPDAGPALRRALTPHRSRGQADGWSLDEAAPEVRERLGQVWWAPADGREPDAIWLRRAQAFVEAARTVHRRAPGFEATWFAAAEANTSFGYPWVRTDAMLASMGQPTLRDVDIPRQAGVLRSLKSLASDPNDTTFWTPPAVSQLDGELVMSHGAMVVVDGRYRGEVSLDFRLDALQRATQRWQQAWADGRSDGLGDKRNHVWVVDRSFNVLADAVQPLQAPKGQGLADTRVQVPLASRLPAGVNRADLDATLFTLDRVHRVSAAAGEGWVLAAAVRIGSPWMVVQAVPESALRAQVLPTLLPNALLGLALLGVFVAGQWLVARWFVAPALQVLAYLRQLSGDPDAAAPQLGWRWRGWVDAVTTTFREHRELQRRERYHEAFKSAMVDHAPTAIVTASGLGHIVDFNPAAERVFGQRRDAVIGRPLADVLLPERHRAAHRAEMARLRADAPGPEQPQEISGLRADGSEFPMEMLAFDIRIEGENFYTAFITDLSARQEAALQIERQRDALRQTEKLSAMGTLLAGVAHELNNPLAIVMGRASLLEEKAPDSELAADARRIREAAERCGRIVRTFLNMARHKPAQRSAVQLNDIVRAAADMLGYTLRSHGIALDLQLAEGLPELQADGDQLGQVVLNLIVNAQQALASVDGPRRITIATGVHLSKDGAAEGEQVWLRVADTGPGVPAAARSSIFEPFFTTKDAALGTGLGLSVSRSIVREHGGDLLLEDGAAGASFIIRLPLEVADGGAGRRDAPPSLASADAEPQARVLVVDDEPEIADLVRAVLEGAGYEVATAESGSVALGLLEEARFDAIVSDVRMPDLDGAGLWRAVRERWPVLARRMLFVTGDTLSPQARQLLDESGCASVDKPFANADLLAAVRVALEA